jgi:integrase
MSTSAAGERPYCSTTLYELITEAAVKAGLEGVTWHTLRHTYRSWLDETGAPMTVQQNLMRHSDIRTTINIYGDALPTTLRTANTQAARMALPN